MTESKALLQTCQAVSVGWSVIVKEDWKRSLENALEVKLQSVAIRGLKDKQLAS
jgi:hypothetical protein